MSFFTVFTKKIKFAPSFTIFFIVNTSKYVSIHNFKKNGGNRFSEFYPSSEGGSFLGSDDVYRIFRGAT